LILLPAMENELCFDRLALTLVQCERELIWV
jgi:hypothetical protein